MPHGGEGEGSPRCVGIEDLFLCVWMGWEAASTCMRACWRLSSHPFNYHGVMDSPFIHPSASRPMYLNVYLYFSIRVCVRVSMPVGVSVCVYVRASSATHCPRAHHRVCACGCVCRSRAAPWLRVPPAWPTAKRNAVAGVGADAGAPMHSSSRHPCQPFSCTSAKAGGPAMRTCVDALLSPTIGLVGWEACMRR